MKQIPPTSFLGFLTLLIAFDCLPQQARIASQTNAPFKVDGIVVQKLQQMTPNRIVFEMHTNTFTVFVMGDTWRILIKPNNTNLHDYKMVTCDGQSTYHLTSFRSRDENERAAGRPVGANDSTGFTRSGTVPCYAFTEEAGAIWLTFGSSCELSRTSMKKQYVPFAMGIKSGFIAPNEKPLIENVEYRLSDCEPKLPLMLRYSWKDPELLEYPPTVLASFPDGCTNVIFSSDSQTNIQNKCFTSKSTTTIRRLLTFKNPPEETFFSEYTVTATKFDLSPELQSFKPEITGVSSINDSRLNRGSGVTVNYLSTNGWPSTSSVATSPAYNSMIMNKKNAEAMEAGRRNNPLKRLQENGINP